MENSNKKSLFTVLILVLLAVASRLLPHPPNFTPITGMTLLGAAYFSRKWMIFIIPILAFWLSDLVLNNVVYSAYMDGFTLFNTNMIFTYGAIILIALIGSKFLKKIKFTNLILASLGSSVIFYLLTNFGTWLGSGIYPKTLAGLGTCMAMGIPFLSNGGEVPFFLYTLVGDLFYSFLLFGAYYLSVNNFKLNSAHTA
jgi:hypothetical protein